MWRVRPSRRRTVGRVDWKSTNSSGSIVAKRVGVERRAEEGEGGGGGLARVVPALERANESRGPEAIRAALPAEGLHPTFTVAGHVRRAGHHRPRGRHHLTAAGRRGRRRLRVHAQGPAARAHRHAVPRARAARPHRRAARRARSRTPTCSPGASTAASSCACAGAWSASATSCRSRCTQIERAESADPAEFLPVAYRNLDELDGFLEHLAREVHDPAYARPARAAARRRRAARRLAPRAVHPRRAPRLPRRAARAHRGGRRRWRSRRASLHPRLNSDLLLCAALVHDLGKTREFTYGAEIGLSRGGAAARPRRARPAPARRARGRAWTRRKRLALAHCVLCHHGPDAAPGRPLRLARGAGPVPAQCAGCECEGRIGARARTSGTKVRRHVHHSVRPAAATAERRRGARRVVQGRAPELRHAGGLRARRGAAAEHRQHADPRRRRATTRSTSTRDDRHDVSTGTELAGLLADRDAQRSCSPRSPRRRASARCRASTSASSPTVGELARPSRRAGVLPVIVLSVLYFIGLIPAFLALVIPGIWLAVAWSVSYPALLSEGIGPVAALGRSFRLVQRPLVADVRRAARDVPDRARDQRHPRRAARRDARSRRSTTRRSRRCIYTIVNTLSSLITLPLFAAVLTIIYFDLRVRKEGFDLQLLARGVGRRERARRARDERSAARVAAARRRFAPPRAGRRASRRRAAGAERRLRAAAGSPPAAGRAPPQLPAARRRPAERRPAGGRRRRSAARATEGPRAEPAARGRAPWRPSSPRCCWARCRRRSRSPRARPDAVGGARAGARDPAASGASAAASVPRPFAGLLRWLGDRLQPVARLLRPTSRSAIPGGRPVLFAILGALVLLAAALLARGSIRRRAAAAVRAARARAPAREDPGGARARRRPRRRGGRVGDRGAPALPRRAAAARRARADRVPPVADHRRGRRRGRLAGVRARRRGLRRDRLRRPAPPARPTRPRAARAGSAC